MTDFCFFSPPTAFEHMAALQLRQLFAASVDEALGSCSEQAFCDGFNLPAEYAQVLARAHQQATDKLRGNALVRCRRRRPSTACTPLTPLRSPRPRIAGGAQPHQR